jgi:AcrR family transcriptional regulator
MDSEISPADPEPEHGDDLLPEPQSDEILDRLIVEEMGEEIATTMRRARGAEEARYRREHPDEGLRERKRRLTRQTISDAATTMFATRGFDNVTVSEVAARVGVSEKTIYNYFPTKESMVLDTADDALADMARALRERRPDESLTDAVLRALESDMRRLDEVSDELIAFLPMFVKMIETTAALRAAWLELYDRLAEVVRDELAAQAGVDPRDPEVAVAGRALVGLVQVALESRVRWIQEGLRGEALRTAVSSDINRAARLLETGLWSFELLARGARAATHARELAQAAELARSQVVSALRQARETWAQVRREHAGHDRHWPGQRPDRALQSQQQRAAAERQREQRTAQAEQRRTAAERQREQRTAQAEQRRTAAERQREQRTAQAEQRRTAAERQREQRTAQAAQRRAPTRTPRTAPSGEPRSDPGAADPSEHNPGT